MIETTAHESRHHLTKGSSNKEDALVTLYGREAGYQWNRVNDNENRHVGSRTGTSLTMWRDQQSENTIIRAGNARAKTIRPSQMDFRQFDHDEAKVLDIARQEIIANETLSQAEQQRKLHNLNALACAQVQCADGVPPGKLGQSLIQ